MPRAMLFELHFDKGNGAMFEVEHEGRRVKCFVSQGNAFLSRKSNPGQNFPSIFAKYATLIAEAAHINISRAGMGNDPWGNHVTESDLLLAEAAHQRAAGRSS